MAPAWSGLSSWRSNSRGCLLYSAGRYLLPGLDSAEESEYELWSPERLSIEVSRAARRSVHAMRRQRLSARHLQPLNDSDLSDLQHRSRWGIAPRGFQERQVAGR